MVTKQDMQRAMSSVELNWGGLAGSFNHVWTFVSSTQQTAKDMKHICVGTGPITQTRWKEKLHNCWNYKNLLLVDNTCEIIATPCSFASTVKTKLLVAYLERLSFEKRKTGGLSVHWKAPGHGQVDKTQPREQEGERERHELSKAANN